MQISKRIIPLLIVLTLCLSACSPGSRQQTDEVLYAENGAPHAIGQQQEQQVGAWQLAVLNVEIAGSLKGSQDSVQYSGDTLSTGIQETPGEGNVFVLIELNADKIETGTSKFVWDHVYVADTEGNRFGRMANDSFLDNYGFERMKATDLTLGNNQGYICFEIPAQAVQSALTLHYEADEGTATIALN